MPTPADNTAPGVDHPRSKVPGVLRRLLLTLAVLASLATVNAASPDVAHADGGLDITSTTTYTIDAASSVVRVRGEFTLTNTLPDQVTGNVINRRYFAGFSVPAPAASANPVATTASGRPLQVTTRSVPDVADYVLYDIDLASDLFYRDTARVVLTYDITGNPPRADNPTRVNPAYAAFGAFGVGDEGQVTVRVVVPDGFEVDVLGSDTVVTHEDGTTVYTATDIPNPLDFQLFVSARNDEALAATDVTSPDGDEFDLRAWPGDAEWQQFVTDQIHVGVPQLAELIGREWPIDGPVVVREAYTPYLFGYAGWFSAVDRELEVGEDLDAEVVLHELSHAWFNESWFTERWINEGLAQVYSNQAVAAAGGSAVAPDPIDPADPGALALAEWGDPDFVDGADAREPFGYNASYWVMQQIVDEVGAEAMRDLFAAVDDGTIAYVGDLPAETGARAADWRRFLDLAEEVAGSSAAADLLADHVVRDDQATMLDERATARVAYRRLEDDGGDWAPPLAVRRAMADWTFDTAAGLIDDAEAVLDVRDDLDEAAAALGVGYPDSLESGYEAADRQLDDVHEAVQAQLDATGTVAAAVAEDALDDGWFETIGLWGTDVPALLNDAKGALERGDLDAARADADEAQETLADASSVGITRFLLAAGALLLLVLIIAATVTLVRRHRRRATDDTAEDTAVEGAPAEDAPAEDTAVEPTEASTDVPAVPDEETVTPD